ncbi:hypothetical protein FT663_02909 [Candidozyma haemuli var. vulneris]|uniref:F-box domain-containing protein n=1 Tax=Candidozyma haemuli TaxID=45357 RepID=A0A2V1ASC4_9ASCO|nr:hypothetical protein CXQ85_004516 [[Candida] haemuloni]KAF3991039.1 hypothetical protein FT663_02909 [[Candida] haemuloni var. vulneris]KAF3991337.1 hypothetical protein FT662_01792 [[Candida] haemuloni var. vulneris]PVH21000.1 hypothetical protein CXQ85_004516 [[Candida] haemuloni]
MTSFLLDVPVGYAKNPVEPRHEPFRSSLNSPCLEPPSYSILDGLPHEIRSLVAVYLNQHDALNLALTCKELAASCLPRLYHTVIVDANYTEFSKEYDLSSTYIKSSYSFKKLIQRYQHQYPIHVLSVVSLPDSMNIYDIDINEQLLRFFSKLRCLRSLSWLSDNFKLEYLKRLPCQASMEQLNLNIKFSNYLGELTSNCPLFNFINLSHFHIRPFYNQNRLIKIIDSLLVCDNAAAVERNLNSLRLSRFDKDTNAVLPSPRELDGVLWETAAREGLYVPHPREYELGTLQAVFRRSKLQHVKLTLTELCLNDFLVCERDAKLLANATDLTRLQRLELRNVSEYGQSTIEETSPGFLGTLAPLLNGLMYLNLDYRETRRDSVPLVLGSCPNLVELDLVIRMNEIKSQHVDPDSLYQDYSTKLSEQTKLTKLSLELREETSFCDVALATPTTLIHGIQKLRQLLALRLNPSDTSRGMEEFLALLGRLQKLEILDVFGTRAGGAPHMALGAVHPNVYDEWFKVQHVAFLYGETQKSLRYVRINKCIFEYTGSVEPRDEIDRWFEGRVRVGD